MRKLAIGSITFTLAVLCACKVDNTWACAAFAAVFLCCGLLIFLLGEKRLKVLEFVLIFFAAGLFWTSMYSCLTTERAKVCSGEDVEITARITDYPVKYDDYARVYIRIISGAPKLKAVLYDSSEDSVLTDMEPGRIIRFTARLKSADKRYGEDYNYYNSIGVYFTASVRSGIKNIGSEKGMRELPSLAKRRVALITEQLYESDIFPFMKSLLLGDKSDFYNDKSMSTAMSRAGIMHVVAVSGMHISFLVGFIRIVFGKSKRSSIICMILIWFFAFMTGAAPSAIRAGFMQSLLLLAPFFNREDDPVTSLAFSLLVILLFNPFAIYSISLQLSFGAMAGILIFSSRLNDFFERLFPQISKSRVFVYLSGIAASSLSVMIFTVPLTAYHFRSVQVLSIFTNLLVLWAVSICFCGGYISVLISFVNMNAAKLIAIPVSLLAKHITGCAGLIASIPFSSLYISSASGTGIIAWLVFVYVLVILAYFSKKGGLYRLVIPLFLSLLSLVAVLYSSYSVNRSTTGILSVIDVGQGQCISIFSGDDTYIIDCGSSKNDGSAGETAGEYLQSCGRFSADALILTHLHKDHTNGISTLLEYIDIKEIIIPANTPDEDGMLEEICNAAVKKGTTIEFLDSDYILNPNRSLSISLYPPNSKDSGEANELCLFAKVTVDGYDTLISGDSGSDAEIDFIKKHPIKDAELLIVGHHGSKYSSTEEYLSSIGCNTAVISCGYNSYGHPTYETLYRLNSYGYKVYRTDLNGTIRLKLG